MAVNHFDGQNPEPNTRPRVAARFQTMGARMWLMLFGVAVVTFLGFGLGSVLADLFERDGPL
jgi:hypothetical protein